MLRLRGSLIAALPVFAPGLAVWQSGDPGALHGPVSVVTSSASGSAQLGADFHGDAVIDVLDVSPAAGSSLGGTRVQVTGSAFAVGGPVPEVFFGAARATSVERVSDTRLDCTTPAGPSGVAVDVRVSGANGADTLAGGFRYFPGPRITAVAPVSGSAAGGNLVTLSGVNFTKNGAGPNRVTFGDQTATGIVARSDGTIQCLVPSGTGGTSVDVLVSNANGSWTIGRGYRYHRQPTLASVTPERGLRAGGSLITLRGSGFRETGAAPASVLLGSEEALDVTILDDTTLTCRTPAAACDASVNVEVRNQNGSAVLVRGFRYVLAPLLLGLEPSSGPAYGGTTITLRGVDFQAIGAGWTEVFFGSAPAGDVQVIDDATLTCTAPIGLPSSSVDVVLSNRNGTARLTAAYRYLAPPTISALNPDRGEEKGGTRVRISGSGFLAAGAPSVRFGATEALAVVVLDDRVLECSTPPSAPGAVDVSLLTQGGTAVLRKAFAYGSPIPTLSGLEPDHGPSLGGTAVELHGSNFVTGPAGSNRVLFGGVQATSVVAPNDTLLRCMVPPGPPGAMVDVRVVNANGGVTRPAAYRYHLRPDLASVTPAQGSPLGDTIVTLRGSGFLAEGAHDFAVRFGTVPAGEIQVLDDGRLTCRAPPGVPDDLVDVAFSNSNGSALLADGFRYGAAPTLASIAPASGTPLGGAMVFLTGTGFVTGVPGQTRVHFGAALASNVTIADDDSLSCLAPAGTPGTSVDVTLENPNGAVTLRQAYRYHAAPAIATLAPGNGPAAGGTTVVLTGSGFMAQVIGTNAVTFGGLPASGVITVDDTRVRAVAPGGAAGTSVDLVLSNSNGSARVQLGFRYNAVPTIGALEPGGASSLGGKALTIRGSGFLRDGAGANSVSFGAAQAGSVSVLDDRTLSCVTPAAPAGSEVVVSVTNRNGTARAPDPFRFHPAPRVDAIVPASGFSAGGDWVEIRGAGWLANEAGTNSVLFGAAPAAEVAVVGDAVLRCLTPAGVAGPVTVSVANGNGSAALSDGFYYDWAPTLTGCQPGRGSSLGGTEVRLTGAGFATPGAGPLSVRFGASAATNVRIQDGQSLLCNVPAGPAGTTVSVVVSNTHGSSSWNGFAYHPRPTITSVAPAQGAPEGGTQVTLRGTGFSANGAGTPVVSFDAKSASGVSVVDDTTVRCIAPNGPDRTWPEITLLNANGKASIAGEFRWLSRNPNDLDEDGLGDALVSGEDAVYVFFGTASGLEDESTAAADLVLLPSTSGTDFGAQLACGDVNADQIVDLIVSAPLDGAGGSGTGAVFVFFGPLAPSPTPRAAGSASAVFHGAANYDHFGSSVSVCDVTGDGQADLLVGAPLNDASGSNGGAVYVFRGSAAFTGKSAGQANVRLIAKDREEYFGSALACGDVTGDRIADIVVGAPHIGATGNDTGTAYLFRGGASLTSANADAAAFRLDGVSRRDLLGSSVVVADFDGDGIGDLLLGAPGVSGDAGALYWLRGGPTLSSRMVDVSSVELDAESSGDLLGQVVAAGDVDGDGKADLLASAPRHDVPSANAGRAYLVRGGTFQDGGIAARAHTIFLAENSSGDLFGSGLGIIDLDGDGAGDVLIGAPFSNRGGQDSGQVYLFLGSALQVTRSAGADDATLTGAAASLTLGREIGGTR